MAPKNTYYDIVVAAAGTLMYYVIFDAIALAATLILSTCLVAPLINYMECHSQSSNNTDGVLDGSYPPAVINMFSLTFLLTFSLFFLLAPQTSASVNLKTRRGPIIGYSLVALTAVFISIHYCRIFITKDGFKMSLFLSCSFFGVVAGLLFAGALFYYQVTNFHLEGFTTTPLMNSPLPSTLPPTLLTKLGDIKNHYYY